VSSVVALRRHEPGRETLRLDTRCVAEAEGWRGMRGLVLHSGGNVMVATMGRLVGMTESRHLGQSAICSEEVPGRSC
jgi:hypothetical protein